MVSKGMQMVIKVLKKFQDKVISYNLEDTRRFLDKLSSMTTISKEIKIESINIDGITAEWIYFPESRKDKILLYLHGGGYVAGSLQMYRDLASRISKSINGRSLLIDYRLAPENEVFPAALEDATKTYQWLISKMKIPPKNVIIAGDSAGGGLSLALLLNLKNNNIALPAAAICLSPWTDLTLSGNSIKANADQDPFISLEVLEFYAKTGLMGKNPRDPLISPLFGDFTGLPPILIQVGTAECLLDDSIRVAKIAKKAGVDMTLDIWDDMVHVFQIFASVAPESQEAIKKMGEFTSRFLN